MKYPRFIIQTFTPSSILAKNKPPMLNIDMVKLWEYASDEAKQFLYNTNMFRRATPESLNDARKRVVDEDR